MQIKSCLLGLMHALCLSLCCHPFLPAGMGGSLSTASTRVGGMIEATTISHAARPHDADSLEIDEMMVRGIV